MEEVTGTELYEYRTEEIVEITGIDSNGEFATVSYQFAFGDEELVIRPKEDIEPQHKQHIEATLKVSDYTLKET